MTEQEAKTKWCPNVRVLLLGNSFVANRLGCTRDEAYKCIASECMMWRWSSVGAFVNGKYDDNYPAEGYCGLGGKP